MAIEDQLTTFKSSLDSIKTALSNKGVSTSGSLKADQVSSKISSINTNQSTTKNMGSQSVTFTEKTFTVTLECAWNSYYKSKTNYGLTAASAVIKIKGISGSGNGKTYSPTQKNRGSKIGGSYSNAANLLSAYQEYKKTGTWPTPTKQNSSTVGYSTGGCTFTYTNVLPGTYQLFCDNSSNATPGLSWPTFTVSSSDVSKGYGLFTTY